MQKCLTLIILQTKTKEHNPKWPEIPDHSYRTLIIGGFESGKTNALPNLINHEADTDKNVLYAKDLFEAKYQLLTIVNKKKEKVQA